MTAREDRIRQLLTAASKGARRAQALRVFDHLSQMRSLLAEELQECPLAAIASTGEAIGWVGRAFDALDSREFGSVSTSLERASSALRRAGVSARRAAGDAL